MRFLYLFKKFSSGTKNYIFSAFFIFQIFLLIPLSNISAQNEQLQFHSNKDKKAGIFSLSKSNYEIIRIDSPQKNTGNVKFKMKKDPWKAVLYSAVLPGAGQFYNQSYWKIPVIVGLGAYFAYGWIDNNNQYLDYKQQYINSQTETNPFGDQQLLNLRNFYQDQRDNFIIYSSILYLVNLVDAYVDAQLFDFDVSDNVKFGILQREKLVKLSYGF